MTAGLTVFLTTDASAQSLEDMQKQLEALQSQVKDLEQQMETAKSEDAAPKADDGSDVKVKWKGGPEFSTADGKNTLKIRGRLGVDMAVGSQDAAVTGAQHLDATEFRSARIGVEGVSFGDFKYTFEVEFAGAGTEIADGYIAYEGWPVEVKVGQFKTPNSLEEETSGRFVTFMERASITDAFDLERQIGAQLKAKGDIWTLAGGVFRGSADSFNTDEGLTVAARATIAPKFGDKGLVHVGVHARHRKAGDGVELFRYRQRPHQHLADQFLNTGFFADSDRLLGAEAAVVYGPFALQSEYMALKANAADPAIGHANFDGYYLSGSWFITGESRNYKDGSFNRVHVSHPVFEGGSGAVQVAARFDTVDLSDGAIDGGTQDSYIFGVNWHLNDYVRMMANYNISKIKGGANDGADINLFGLRAQVDW